MKKGLATFITCCLLILMLMPVSAKADSGPKPSVHITFENMDSKQPCYGTLLSETKSTGPASVWDGTAENARYQSDNKERAIWKAFVDYKDSDGFYFLQNMWDVSDSHTLDWTYFPPEKFKILLYYPTTKKFVVSDICDRYAFDSYYSVKMNGTQLDSVNKNLPKMIVKTQKRLFPQYLSFLFRVNLTIIIELLVAFFLNFRKKNMYILFAITNIVTQVLLNIALNMYYFSDFTFDFILTYFLMEVLVFVIEAIVYGIMLSKISKTTISKVKSTAYALVANISSFVVGLIVAAFCPWLF